MRVLLIDGDLILAKSVEIALAAEGIVSDISMLGEDGLEFSRMYRYDLIILDLVLPDINGNEILRALRASNCNVPILIISGLSSAEDKVNSLGYGADDYLTKPFDCRELVARVKAITRRARGYSASTFKISNLAVNINDHSTHIDEKAVHLTAKEQVLMEVLAMRKGNVVSKEHLLSQLYNPVDEPELKIIDVFVCKMRKKLYESSGGLNYIETVWGRGYALKDPYEDSVMHRAAANQ